MQKLVNRIKSGLKQRPIETILLGSFLIILGLLPFHALFSTWLSSNFGAEELFKSWKELWLLALLPLTAVLLRRNRGLTRTLLSRRINQLIVAYIALHFIILAWQRPDLDAALAGMAFNLRFFAMFLGAQLLSECFQTDKLRQIVLKIVLITGAAVAIFGAIQVLFLPDDFLIHFGYSDDDGIRPYLTIDENPDYVRINSTLRGPNPLGAYMAVFILIFLGWLMKTNSKYKWRYGLILVPALISLYASYSRSAWIGFATGLAFGGFVWAMAHEKYRALIFRGALVAMLLIPIGLIAISGTSFYEHTILHNNLSDNRPADSNSNRLLAYQNAFSDALKHPLGQGPGTAGTASFYNDDTTSISENYYIQIAQEIGIIGALIFVGIILLAAVQLWFGRSDPIQLALLSGLVSMSIVSLFLHGWQDETVAMTWWGFAGLYFRR